MTALTITAIREYVARNPGQTIEQIGQALGQAPRKVEHYLCGCYRLPYFSEDDEGRIYVTEDEMSDSESVYCPTCGEKIGLQHQYKGRWWLWMNNLEVKDLHGRCQCGAEIHWTAGEVRLAALVKHCVEVA